MLCIPLECVCVETRHQWGGLSGAGARQQPSETLLAGVSGGYVTTAIGAWCNIHIVFRAKHAFPLLVIMQNQTIQNDSSHSPVCLRRVLNDKSLR